MYVKIMRSTIVNLFVCLLLLYNHASKLVASTSEHPILVIIGFDGFRPDYLKRGLTPTLAKFVKDGVSTDYLQNVFPTKTMTNFFSIATGMYAETHGVLGNTVFNENLDCIRYGYELYHSTNVTPMWTLNELTGNGRRSGAMMWGGGEFEFNNILPTYYEPYNSSIPWHERINRTMEWLIHDEKPVNLLNIYFEQPDMAGHMYGIEVPEFNEQLKRVDEIFDYFLKQLHTHDLDNKVDIIVLSDHGMIDLDRSHIINVTQDIKSTGGKSCGTSPVLQVTTTPDERISLYNRMMKLQQELKTFTVYKYNDIPEHWHFKRSNRNTEFLLVGNIPYGFDNAKYIIGEHGYDNDAPQMRAFFAAKGPHFRENYHHTSLKNIDIYALVSYMLSLDPSLISLKPNGSLSDIITILNTNVAFDYMNPAKRNVLNYFIPRSPIPSLERTS